MHKLISSLAFILSLSALSFAQINDVSKSDGDYKSIKSSVDNGYLSVFSDQSFKPEKAVTRREMAFILNSVTKKLEEKPTSISSADIKELKALSQSFKSLYTDTANELESSKKTNEQITAEQALLHSDISALHDRITELNEQNVAYEKKIKENNKRLYLIMGIIAVFGVMLGGG
jgi:septal ring factor EnvC (AmiA/AmiB activator)